MSAGRMTFYRWLMVALLIGAVAYAALGVAVWAAVTR